MKVGYIDHWTASARKVEILPTEGLYVVRLVDTIDKVGIFMVRKDGVTEIHEEEIE